MFNKRSSRSNDVTHRRLSSSSERKTPSFIHLTCTAEDALVGGKLPWWWREQSRRTVWPRVTSMSAGSLANLHVVDVISDKPASNISISFRLHCTIICNTMSAWNVWLHSCLSVCQPHVTLKDILTVGYIEILIISIYGIANTISYTGISVLIVYRNVE